MDKIDKIGNKWFFKCYRCERIIFDWLESCYLDEKYWEVDLGIECGIFDDNLFIIFLVY